MHGFITFSDATSYDKFNSTNIVFTGCEVVPLSVSFSSWTLSSTWNYSQVLKSWFYECHYSFDFISITQKAHRTYRPFSKVPMFTFCGLTSWKKLEYPEETTDLGQVTTTLPHADTENWTWAQWWQAAVVTSEGFTPALSTPFDYSVSFIN